MKNIYNLFAKKWNYNKIIISYIVFFLKKQIKEKLKKYIF